VLHTVLDILDLQALIAAFEGIDTVFHCASVVSAGLLRNPRVRQVRLCSCRC